MLPIENMSMSNVTHVTHNCNIVTVFATQCITTCQTAGCYLKLSATKHRYHDQHAMLPMSVKLDSVYNTMYHDPSDIRVLHEALSNKASGANV